MSDLISRQAAKNKKVYSEERHEYVVPVAELDWLPPAQPEPLSDAYTKAVWTWLLEYQIKAAELKGRYTPYEVLSWVADDWRKVHDRSD